MSDVLDEVLSVISAAPRSAAALTLYALVSTLEHEVPAACSSWTSCATFPPRSASYELMEMMAERRSGDAAWAAAKAQMDESVRCG